MTFTHFALPRRILDSGPKVFVILCCKLFMILFETRDLHKDRGTGATVAVMLGHLAMDSSEINGLGAWRHESEPETRSHTQVCIPSHRNAGRFMGGGSQAVAGEQG
jgi:hypothetical protein